MDKIIVTKENYEKGRKVIRGKDWTYRDQDQGSIFGILGDIHDAHPQWVYVSWMDENANKIRGANYRVGHDNKFDLYFYETEEMFTLDGKLRKEYE